MLSPDQLRPVQMVELDFITLTDFERNFDPMYWRELFIDYWVISVYLAAIYLLLVFGGAYVMKNRKPFKLNGVLALWNIGLSTMSIWAFHRMSPEFFHNLSTEGLYNSVCRFDYHNKANAFWGFVIVLSKVLEFGDTAFVVLRKKELKFIHYYHHVVTAISWWYMYPYYEPVQSWCVVMNTFVHSVMYPYYALRAMQIKLPKIVAMIVTAIQLIQMFVGTFICFYSMWVMYIAGTPADCPHRYEIGVAISFVVYFIFVILFGKFFIDNYVGKAKSKKA